VESLSSSGIVVVVAGLVSLVSFFTVVVLVVLAGEEVASVFVFDSAFGVEEGTAVFFTVEVEGEDVGVEGEAVAVEGEAVEVEGEAVFVGATVLVTLLVLDVGVSGNFVSVAGVVVLELVGL
jgi:hypothetical protein